jgi:hypothetical protein
MVNDMLHGKEFEFINFLKHASDEGKIDWQASAVADQFVASFKGKYIITVGSSPNGARLSMRNDREQEMLSTSEAEEQSGNVTLIYDAARRKALNVETAIQEIMDDPALQLDF